MEKGQVCPKISNFHLVRCAYYPIEAKHPRQGLPQLLTIVVVLWWAGENDANYTPDCVLVSPAKSTTPTDPEAAGLRDPHQR